MSTAAEQAVRALTHIGVWTAICSIAAAPSFYLGFEASGRDPAHGVAMALGVATYIVAYTGVSLSPLGTTLRSRRYLRRAMLIGYGVRLLPAFAMFSLVFPLRPFGLLAMPDMYCGVAAIHVVGWFTQGAHGSVAGYYIITLVQGLILNLIVGAVILLLVAIQRIVLGPDLLVPRPGLCSSCGYDLRASGGACPECGAAIPAVALPPPPQDPVLRQMTRL